MIGSGLMLSMLLAGAAPPPRAPVERDVTGYAVATCLARQPAAYLKDQGDGWGSLIVQRGHGGPTALRSVADAVRAEMARVPMYRIEAEEAGGKGLALPVAYCAEIIDRPVVRAAIGKAVATLTPAYGRSR